MEPREPLFWRVLARVLALPPIRSALIRRAARTPYTHIRERDVDGGMYMERYWLANPYNRAYEARVKWLPSIRLHIIHRPDAAPHPHDHPLRSRVIILRGWYCESRYAKPSMYRGAGDTYSLTPGVDFHNIYATGDRPVVSLFITWPPRPSTSDGTWGFLVKGEKVDRRRYLG